jgi:hypothetical protein
MREIGAFFTRTRKSIIGPTARNVLDEELAKKLA